MTTALALLLGMPIGALLFYGASVLRQRHARPAPVLRLVRASDPDGRELVERAQDLSIVRWKEDGRKMGRWG